MDKNGLIHDCQSLLGQIETLHMICPLSIHVTMVLCQDTLLLSGESSGFCIPCQAQWWSLTHSQQGWHHTCTQQPVTFRTKFLEEKVLYRVSFNTIKHTIIVVEHTWDWGVASAHYPPNPQGHLDHSSQAPSPMHLDPLSHQKVDQFGTKGVATHCFNTKTQFPRINPALQLRGWV
jgi:hypothetical protein